MSHLRNRDWSLWFGISAALLLAIAAIYGPLVAPHDAWFAHQLEDGKPPPFPPSAEFPLGSDRLGHDLLSWLLIGSRTTIGITVAAAILSLAMGLVVLTISAALPWIDRAVAECAAAVAAIPRTTLAIMAVLAIHPYNGPVGFAVALGLIMSPAALLYLRYLTHQAAQAAHLEAAVAIGATRVRIFIRHVLPIVGSQVIVFAALQFAAALILMGELGLLRLVVGRLTRDVDFNGVVEIVPEYPEWSSMLAATRPIRDLYGEAVQVLAPAAALLLAIVAVTTFSEALARRAHELDLWRLFTRRQTVSLLAVVVLAVVPSLFWPSRLEPELKTSLGFPSARAEVIQATLRIAVDAHYGSPSATKRAELLRETLRGDSLQIQKAAIGANAGALEVSGRRLEVGSKLRSLALFDHSVDAPLLLIDPNQRLFSDSRVRQTVLLLVRPEPDRLVALTMAAATNQAAAVIAIASDLTTYAPSTGTYPIPTYALSESAGVELFGRTFPPGYPNGARIESLDARIRLFTYTTAFVGDVVWAIAEGSDTTEDRLLMVVAAFASADGDDRSEAAAAVAAAIHAYLRTAPLRLGVLTLVTPQTSTSVGLAAALSALPTELRERTAAVVVLRTTETKSSYSVVRAQNGSQPLASRAPQRAAEASGRVLHTLATDEMPFAVRSAGVAAPTFVVGSGGVSSPATSALADTGQALLLLLAYLARHPRDDW